MSKKYLYYFSEGNEAFGGDKVTMKNTLGGKGAGLAEMTAAGMPVPQGFTITTDACTQYYADGRQINDEITADIFEHLTHNDQRGCTRGRAVSRQRNAGKRCLYSVCADVRTRAGRGKDHTNRTFCYRNAV